MRTPDGVLWFGTSSGIFVCQPGAACNFTVQNTDASLPRSNSVRENKRKCGAAHAAMGCWRILRDPVVGPVVSELDSEQGLPSQNSFAVQPHGKLMAVTLFSSVRIVVSRDMNRDDWSRRLSATRILSKRVHAPSELPAGLNLEYPQNSLLLEVTAISSRTFPSSFSMRSHLSTAKGSGSNRNCRVNRSSRWRV